MRGLARSAMGESRKRSAGWARIPGAIRAMRRTAPPGSRFRSMLILSFYDVTVVSRRLHSEPRSMSVNGGADAARIRALAAYKDFLPIWKDADPDIPIYKQAKAEYARLQ